jgi:Cell division protein
MSALQWALLIFGVVVVVALVLFSRRDRKAMSGSGKDREPLLPSSEGQMDIFRPEGGNFDEYGVSRPRRVEPTLGAASTRADEPDDEPADRQHLISLIVATPDAHPILGPRLHAALRAQSLVPGLHRIYHRMDGDQRVFSVANLVKPGFLDPADSEHFNTPGVSLFALLPGPHRPLDTLRQLLASARALAAALDAQVFDAERQPLDAAGETRLRNEVMAWEQRQPRR